MKCNSCGMEIPNNSTFCPFCGSSIQNGNVEEVKENNVNVEATPEVENQVTEQPVVETPVVETPVEPVVETPVVETPVEPVVETPVTEPVVEAPITETPVENTTSEVVEPEVAHFETAPVEQENLIVDSTTEVETNDLLGNTAPVKDKKKKNMLPIILLIIVLLVGGFGCYFYFSQMKSSTKRINGVVNGLFSFANEVKNDEINRSSGKYSIEGNFESDEQKVNLSVDGSYALDLKNKLIDVMFNANKADFGGEVGNLIDTPISSEIVLNENKGYILIKDLFSKYIYTESDEIDTIYESLSKQDIDYKAIINGIKVAIQSGLNAADNKQTVGNYTINGKTTFANIIKIKLTAENKKKMTAAFNKSLKNNKTFIEQITKLTNTTEEEFIKSLEEKDEELTSSEATIDIVTDLMGSKLVGINISSVNDDKKVSFVLAPINNGAKVTVKNGDEQVSFTVSKVIKKTDKGTENNLSVSANMDVKGKKGSFEFKFNVTKDKDVNIVKPSLKNSVSVNEITSLDLLEIKNNMSKLGKVGAILSTYMETLIPSEPVTPDYNSLCSIATSCTDNLDGTSDCLVSSDGLDTTIKCPTIAQ